MGEDGSRIPYPRPIVEEPSTEGKTDAQIAAESWAGYLKRNNSQIVDIFQFQVRSEITFPEVGEKSLTFDPMMYLSLHVPKPPHTVQLTVLPLAYPKSAPVKTSYEIDKGKSFKELEHLISQGFIPRTRSAMVPENMDSVMKCYVFADLHENRLYRFYNSERRVSEIHSGDNVWAFEVALLEGVPEEQHEFSHVHLRKRTKSLHAGGSSSYWAGSGEGGSSSSYSFSRFAPPQIFAIQPGVTTNAEVRTHLLSIAESFKLYFGGDVRDVSLTVTSTYGSEEGTPLPEEGPFKIAVVEALSLNFLDLDTASSLPEPTTEAVLGSAGAEGGGDAAGVEVTLEQCLNAFQVREELSEDEDRCLTTLFSVLAGFFCFDLSGEEESESDESLLLFCLEE